MDTTEADLSGIDLDNDQIDDSIDVSVTGAPDADGDGRDDSYVVTDTDGDGVPDVLDLDSDNDSINDVTEAALMDLDEDGFSDLGEGLTDNPPDTDGDMVPDYRDVDSNDDGTFDIEGTDDAALDGDSDGIVDDPTDMDRDGIRDPADGNPLVYGDGTDTDGDGINDSVDEDIDNDGIPNDQDGSGIDSDGDGINNDQDLDSDNDGIPDITEGGGTDADGDGQIDDNTDSDGDGLGDLVDPDTGGTPLPVPDSDGDGNSDSTDSDSDGDGFSDDEESGDGPTPVDTDNDGIPDFQDTDSDNDGFNDDIENGDFDNDGIPDRIDNDDDQLETAVRGAGSLGPLLLLVCVLLVLTRRPRQSVIYAGLLGLSVMFTPHSEVLAQGIVCSTHAGEDLFEPCWYLGAGVGVTEVDPEGLANGFRTVDSRDTGWKGFVGWQFYPHWSAELTYLDGGEAEIGNLNPAIDALIPDANIDYQTPSLMAVYWLREPQEQWNWFAKFGISAIDNAASDSRIPFDQQTSVQLAGGIGARLRFAERGFVRLEAEFYDRDHYYAGLSLGVLLGNPVVAPVSEPEPVLPPPLPEVQEPEVIPEPEPAPEPPKEKEIRCVGVTETLEDVLFALDSAQLTAEAEAALEAYADRIKASDTKLIEIRAHTDSSGAAQYNQKLSTRRARSVEAYLLRQGIDPTRLESRGFGESQPIADNNTAEGRALNRRVEIIWHTDECTELP